MSFTRRKFLVSASAAAVSTGILLNTSVSSIAGSKGLMAPPEGDLLSVLTWDSFEANIGSDFLFQSAVYGSAVLTLAKIADTRPASLRDPARKIDKTCFTLTFTGPVFAPLGTAIYDVSHAALGNFALTITVGGPIKGRSSYQAIINRSNSI